MSQQAATITSLPVAFEIVKAMQADGLDWSEGLRPLGRQAVAEIIERQMARAIDVYLDQLEADDPADRRNGHYRRHLLTERRFREVRRRTRPMGTFQDKTSMDRILFAVFTHENKSQGVSTPFLLTQNY